MLYLILFVFSASFSAILAQGNSAKYSAELERSVIKPRACGSYYFENLQEAFMYNFRGPMVSEPLKVAEFCEKFSLQYNVTLNILDQNGIDQCIFRNPQANLFTIFLNALNRRNALDRLEFYQNIRWPFNNTGPLIVNISNFDAAGLLKFYIQVFYNHTNNQAIETINENIYNITQYPDSGPQYVPVITKQSTQSNIFASYSPDQIKSLFLRVFTEEQYDSLGSIPAIKADILLLFLLVVALERTVSDPALLPNALQHQIMILLESIGTYGMAKNLAIPLITNLIQDGVCYWGFNNVYHNGIMYRIVFSQSRSAIITIKK